jgi:Icc-related predicted phosphoesterase
MEAGNMLRVAAVSDIHYSKTANGTLEDLFRQASQAADVLLLCGDLTDHGLPEEVEVLTADIHAHISIPVLAVLGNHDFESGNEDVVRDMLEDAGVKVLDGDCVVVEEIGFAGVSGFAGGFDRWALNPWGERAIKQFVQATIDEVLKLETALSRLETERRLVLLHYAPIRQTIEGEPPEIFPFLGSSRLEDPLNHYGVDMAFHGHAHKGTPEGHTAQNVPIYNVSMPLLRKAYPDRPAFRVVEIARPT